VAGVLTRTPLRSLRATGMLWRLRGVLRGYVALPGLRFAPSGLRARCGVCLAFSGLHDAPDSASLPPGYGTLWSLLGFLRVT